ncbi:unnamed protein product [Mytilus edulis]|uniref:Tc1-like transposase DDE domain-containing protein n=1 Tax=Mytilus edulis TaxID=6550 RepID=A0A8S3TVB1_MYTED|nr:unnamed protein product [Mytilus edulis]
MAERKRILSSHSKEIVYNVSKFFESQIQQPTSTPVKAHTERAAEATLVSEATIRRIRREKNEKGDFFHQKDRKLNLRLHEIQFDNKLLRPQLLALAKANNQTPKYVIDNIARERGHDILRLPPYHPDLNPIELIWNQVKQSVASRNVTHRIDDVLKLAHEAVADITVSDWEKTCRHVAIIEEEYRKRDIVIDEQMERLIIDLADSSDSDSDNDDNV